MACRKYRCTDTNVRKERKRCKHLPAVKYLLDIENYASLSLFRRRFSELHFVVATNKIFKKFIHICGKFFLAWQQPTFPILFFHIFLALIRCFFSFRRVYFQIWNCMPKQQKCLRLSCVCSFHHSAVVKYFSVAFCFLSLPVAAGQKQECGQKIFFSDLHWDIFLGLKSVLKYLKSISLLNALKYFLRFHLNFVCCNLVYLSYIQWIVFTLK